MSFSTHPPENFTTVDWANLIRQYQGIRGISLRRLIEETSLYSCIEDAEIALDDANARYTPVRYQYSRNPRRYRNDRFLNFHDAVLFTASSGDRGKRLSVALKNNQGILDQAIEAIETSRTPVANAPNSTAKPAFVKPVFVTTQRLQMEWQVLQALVKAGGFSKEEEVEALLVFRARLTRTRADSTPTVEATTKAATPVAIPPVVVASVAPTVAPTVPAIPTVGQGSTLSAAELAAALKVAPFTIGKAVSNLNKEMGIDFRTDARFACPMFGSNRPNARDQKRYLITKMGCSLIADYLIQRGRIFSEDRAKFPTPITRVSA